MNNLSEIQLKTRQSYKTYKDFLDDYKPEQLIVIYDDINTIEQSVLCVRLTIDDVDKVYSGDKFSAGIDYLSKWLDFVNRFSNINKPLVEIKAVAIMIFTDYKHLHLSDLKVLFKNLMIGAYGSFYGSVDAQRILTAFATYSMERKKTIASQQSSMELFVNSHFSKLYSEADKKAYAEAEGKDLDHIGIAKLRGKHRQEIDQNKQRLMTEIKKDFYEHLKARLK